MLKSEISLLEYSKGKLSILSKKKLQWQELSTINESNQKLYVKKHAHVFRSLFGQINLGEEHYRLKELLISHDH